MRHYKLRRHKGCERKCLPSETKVPSTGFKEIEVAQSFEINFQVCLVFKPYFVADFLVLLSPLIVIHMYSRCIWRIRSNLAARTARLLLCANFYSSCVCKGDRFKDNLSLTWEPTTSRQKHFSTRISLPATHQGSVKVSSKVKHLGSLRLLRTNFSETTFNEDIY